PSLPPPNEAARVTHPAGFSIIVPQGWETHRLFVDAKNQPISLLRSYPARSTGTQPELTAQVIAPPSSGDGDTIEAEGDERWSLTHFRNIEDRWFRITISVPEVDRTGRDD